ncbi:MAG: hypothetical protein K5634_05430 [Sphaerochaetaceae bacterium]|nr:hypothetical protein [Sphaerochaetaceae bacterium]
MKKFTIVLLLLILACSAVFADSYYEKGDTMFSVNAGITYPGFLFFPNRTSGDKFVAGVSGTHMAIGGYASLSYQVFLNRSLALGGQIGYAFNNSQAGIIFATVPITGKLTFVPVQSSTFDLKFSFNGGVSVLRYNTNRFLSPFASITVNPTYYFNNSWGVGIEAGMWAWYESYPESSSNNKYEDTCLGAMVPITISLTYRH